MMQLETGWKKDDIKLLFKKVLEAKEKNLSLGTVFNEMSKITKHKPNSVRNFYYNFLCLLQNSQSLQQEYKIDITKFQKIQFETFNPSEIDLLIEHILIEYNKGKSVRKILFALSGGDRQKMLRYQNKYRSVIANHRDKVERIMCDLDNRGVSYYNPYKGKAAKEFVAYKSDIYSNMCYINEQIKTNNDLNLYLLLNLCKQMIDNIINRINMDKEIINV